MTTQFFPAFPQPLGKDGQPTGKATGMNMLHFFTAAAMQGLLANPGFNREDIAEASVKIAESVLKKLDERGK